MISSDVFMAFPAPQHAATFLHRKQRFLASMELADGSQELVYCANSGAMAGALSSGSRALIWDSGDTTRKRRFTWRAIETGGLWVGTDTHLSNRIVEEALRLGLIPGLTNMILQYGNIWSSQVYGRIFFCRALLASAWWRLRVLTLSRMGWCAILICQHPEG